MSHALKAHRLCEEIVLPPLAEDDILRYLSGKADRAQAQTLAHWIQEQTEGNPLFMVTVLDHLLALGHVSRSGDAWNMTTPLEQIDVSVPDTLRQMIELQIESLSPREQLILGAASVHGMECSAALAANVLEIDMEGAEDACQKLADQRHIIRATAAERSADGSFSQRYEFVHALFRSVLYQRLAPARRAKLHRRFGEALEAAADDRAGIAAELAGHFTQCADWSKTVEYLRLAAKNAVSRFDYREAMRLLEQALEVARNLSEADRSLAEIRILQRLSILQHALHDSSRVLSTLETLAARSQELGMPEVSIRALSALAMLRANEDARDGLVVLERVERLIREQSNSTAQMRARALCASLRFGMCGWDPELAAEHAAALSAARAGGDRFELATTLMDHSYLQWASSRYADSARSAEESLPLLADSGRLVRYLHGLDLIATNLTMLGQWGRALDILDQSIDKASQDEAPDRLAMPLIWKAWLHLEAMDFHGALEMCARALPLLGRFMRDRNYITRRLEAAAELGLGRVDRALDQMAELRDEVAEHPVMLSWYWLLPLQLDVANAWLAKGDLAAARREADRAVELTQKAADRTWQALAWDLSARVALQEMDLSRAKSDLKNALEAMQGFEIPLAAWRVHATAAGVYRSNEHLQASRWIVEALAQSLDSRPALQGIFLASRPVAELARAESAAALGS